MRALLMRCVRPPAAAGGDSTCSGSCRLLGSIRHRPPRRPTGAAPRLPAAAPVPRSTAAWGRHRRELAMQLLHCKPRVHLMRKLHRLHLIALRPSLSTHSRGDLPPRDLVVANSLTTWAGASKSPRREAIAEAILRHLMARHSQQPERAADDWLTPEEVTLNTCLLYTSDAADE